MAKNISKAKIACAYIRVSTDKQEELSPDAQKRLVIDYAKKNKGVPIGLERLFLYINGNSLGLLHRYTKFFLKTLYTLRVT